MQMIKMQGAAKLAAVSLSTPRMEAALPDLPMRQAVMVRLVRILSASMTDYFDPVFRKAGLSEHSFHVLCLLMASEEGHAAPSELSDLVGTSRGNMTRILESLVKDGWVSRRVEPTDGRRHLIEITPKGRDLAMTTVPRISDPLQRAFAPFTPDQMDHLAIALEAVILSFDKAG